MLLPDALPDWLSCHIYFQGDIFTPASDRVLTQIVTPYVQTCQSKRWVGRFFFIRYADPRSHIRLRLLCRGQEWRDAIMAELPASLHDEQCVRLNRPITQSTPEQIAYTDLAWQSYDPEFDRYGGMAGIDVAHRLFHVTSEMTLTLLTDGNLNSVARRLGTALLLMTALAFPFLRDRSETASFFRNYGHGYMAPRIGEDADRSRWMEIVNRTHLEQASTLSAYVEELWHRLDSGQPLSAMLDRYYPLFQQARDELETCFVSRQLNRNGDVIEDWKTGVWSIVPSYIHMMNNRLGVSVEDEILLSLLIAKTLDKADAQPKE